jgi:RNA 2',3'-cyclic 3'-phosphodiesterase
MRLFLGLSVPDALSLELISVRDQAVAAMATVRPTPVVASNFHMTLVFIGEVSETRATEIAGAVDSLRPATQPLQLQLQRAHCFPDSAGRVFAVEAPLGAELSRLHQRLLRLLAMPEQRSLRPHITLARLQRPFVPATDIPLGLNFEAAELCLYESQRSQWGVRYRPRRRWPLPA